MISETKLDESFPPSQFLLDDYSVPFPYNESFREELIQIEANGNNMGFG